MPAAMRLLRYLLFAVTMSASLAKVAAGEPSLAGQAAPDDRVAELTGQAQQAMAAGRFDAAEAAFLELTKFVAPAKERGGLITLSARDARHLANSLLLFAAETELSQAACGEV
jgi:hypothetical protein